MLFTSPQSFTCLISAGRRKHQRVGMDWTADVCPLIPPISPGMRHIARDTRPSGNGTSALAYGGPWPPDGRRQHERRLLQWSPRWE